MWQEMLAPHIASGEIVAVGVVQEQHGDRAALYRQWRQLDWPIFIDSLNLLDLAAVPIPMGLSPSGHVVYERLRNAEDLRIFLQKDLIQVDAPRAPLPHPLAGDADYLAGALDKAIESYATLPDDARAQFRLGVALRRRYEAGAVHPTDGQKAVAAWGRALGMDPNQYIWRRRLQQYGPRLAKPYNFYGWIEEARRGILARKETPLPLAEEPRGAELLDRGPVVTVQLVDPDPERRIALLEEGFVRVDSIVTPAQVRPGERARIRLVFRPQEADWNDDAGPLAVFFGGSGGVAVMEGLFAATGGEAGAARTIEFEVEVGAAEESGRRPLQGVAIVELCEKATGVCRRARIDLGILLEIDGKAPVIR